MRSVEIKTAKRRNKILRLFLRAILPAGMLCIFSVNASAQAFYKGIQNIQITTGYGGFVGYRDVNKSIKDSSKGTIRNASTKLINPKTKHTQAQFDNKILTSPYSFAFHYEYGYKAIRAFGYKRKKLIGIGGYLGTRTFREREPSPPSPVFYDRRWRYYTLMFEGKLHWDFPTTRFDPYINVSLGLQLARYKIFDALHSNITPTFPKNKIKFAGEVSGGLRYFVARNLAVLGEAGFGVYYVKIGINLILVP